MKITLIRHNRQHQLCVTVKSISQVLERMLHDDSKFTVERFRKTVPYLQAGYEGYKDMPTWHHVCPAAEFQKDANGNLVMKRMNGLLLLSFQHIEKEELVAQVKKWAAFIPSTMMTLVGADGRSVEVLVKFTDAQGNLPSDEKTADVLYRTAYHKILPVYQSLIKPSIAQVAASVPSIHNDFLLTLDAAPYFNADAAAFKVDREGFDVEQECKVELPNEKSEEDVAQMINFLRGKYELRYNKVMRYTEYQPKNKGYYGWRAIEPRVQKRMTLEVQLAGINVSIKDVRNFLESDYIESYDPVGEYMSKCYGQWDGHDHIRALARTVPTDNPHWEDWFYTWFLAMVEQWRHYGHRQYGNSVAPLLISKQGYNKSTFCRRLLPPEFQWGYNDNLVLSEKRQVLLAMCQFLLINLDEFNQVSPSVQQGFLKNLIQLPSVKVKPPYGSHVEENPRMASFIATSNMDDILTDPSGNRRFIGIELTGPIDVSVRPNYFQLFAQAEAAIRRGEKTYFDAEQTALIMENNKRYQMVQPMELCFGECFEITADERKGEYMTVASIFDVLKKKYGASLEAKSLLSFGRSLKNMEGMKRKRTMKGTEYLVIKRY